MRSVLHPMQWVAAAALLGLGFAQSGQAQSLSLSANNNPAGGSIVVSVLLSGAGTLPAAVQWSVTYPSSAVASVTPAAGSISSGAGKTVKCNGGTCVLYGIDSRTVQNGVLAVITYQLSSAGSADASSFTLASGLGASAAGGQIDLAVANSAISVTTTSLPSARAGVAYSAALAATGGSGSYVWSLASGSLPAGLTLNSNGTISGTPAAGAAASSFIAQATDASNQSVTGAANLSIAVAGSSGSPVTISLSGSQGAGQQPTLSLANSGANIVALNGTLTLAFASSVTGDSDDPNVQFVQANASSGSRQVAFTIPAQATTGTFANGATKLATGTVAGTITITTSLTDANGNAVTAPAPITIPVNAAAPVITKVTVTSSSGTITIAVTGFSTPRDMQTLTFHFAPVSGTTLSQSDIPVSVTSPFTTYYAGTASKTSGSQFTATVPFTFPGAQPVASLTVDATNSQGTSARSSSVSP